MKLAVIKGSCEVLELIKVSDEKSVLELLADEGFVDTHSFFADLRIYKSEKEYVLYDDVKKRVYCRYELNGGVVKDGKKA